MPALRSPGIGVLATGGLTVLALVLSVSPASAAIRVLASGSAGPVVRVPVAATLAGLLLAFGAGTVSSLVARSRGI